MADYVLLYSGGGTPESEEEGARVMKAWTDWFAELGAAIKDGGNPFSGSAKTVAKGGSVSDGVRGTPHTGYSIVSTDSIDAAAALAKGCPIFERDGTVTVYETLAM